MGKNNTAPTRDVAYDPVTTYLKLALNGPAGTVSFSICTSWLEPARFETTFTPHAEEYIIRPKNGDEPRISADVARTLFAEMLVAGLDPIWDKMERDYNKMAQK